MTAPADLLKEIIAIPAFSREEDRRADFLESAWQQASHEVHRKGNNLWLMAPDFDPAKPVVLLNSHIDTVRPVSGWTKEPLAGAETADGRIYGLGSNDAGASLVSLYAAFEQLIRRPQPYSLLFLASCEEEISGKGGMESVLGELPSVAFALVGEPTAMQPAIAERGLLVLDCIARGKAGHAARNEGVNAITEAIRSIGWFHSYVFPKQSDLLGGVKMTVTLIEAGTQHNVIPDLCRFTVDVRTNERYTNGEVLDEIRRLAGCEVTARRSSLNSSRMDVAHPFVQRALAMGKQPFGSPTLSDQALMTFPSVKMGPGDSARSHTADEYILRSEIDDAVTTYVRLLDGLQL